MLVVWNCEMNVFLYYIFGLTGVGHLQPAQRGRNSLTAFRLRSSPIQMTSTKLETRPQAYKRITDGIRSFVNHSVGAAKLVLEAKRLEIWKERWSSWKEYCENEFGTTKQRVYQLLDVASAIEDIQGVKPFDSESGKNKEILANLNSRQAAELKGLPPDKKAEVFHKAIAV